jgi:hypothetical protein
VCRQLITEINPVVTCLTCIWVAPSFDLSCHDRCSSRLCLSGVKLWNTELTTNDYPQDFTLNIKCWVKYWTQNKALELHEVKFLSPYGTQNCCFNFNKNCPPIGTNVLGARSEWGHTVLFHIGAHACIVVCGQKFSAVFNCVNGTKHQYKQCKGVDVRTIVC